MWVPMATKNLAFWVQGGTRASLRLIVGKTVMGNNSLFEVRTKEICHLLLLVVWMLSNIILAYLGAYGNQ